MASHLFLRWTIVLILLSASPSYADESPLQPPTSEQNLMACFRSLQPHIEENMNWVEGEEKIVAFEINKQYDEEITNLTSGQEGLFFFSELGPCYIKFKDKTFQTKLIELRTAKNERIGQDFLAYFEMNLKFSNKVVFLKEVFLKNGQQSQRSFTLGSEKDRQAASSMEVIPKKKDGHIVNYIEKPELISSQVLSGYLKIGKTDKFPPLCKLKAGFNEDIAGDGFQFKCDSHCAFIAREIFRRKIIISIERKIKFDSNNMDLELFASALNVCTNKIEGDQENSHLVAFLKNIINGHSLPIASPPADPPDP